MLAALLAASLCAGAGAQQTTGNSFLDQLGRLKDALAASAPAGTPTTTPTPALPLPLSPGAAQTARQVLGPAQGAPLSADLAPLFAKGTVTGADLYGTLKKMREDMRAKRTAQAWAALNSGVDQASAQLQSGAMPDWKTLVGQVAMGWFEQQLKTSATQVGMKALDDFLATVLEDTGGLASETITLPVQQGMTDAQGKRIVTMATLVVTARLAEKMLNGANANLKTLQTDYASLLDQREKATALLFALVDQRRNAQRAGDSAKLGEVEGQLTSANLTRDDIAFIDKNLLSLNARDFSRDMAAQNLALRVLRQQKPDAFAQYQVKADDVVARTRAYLKAVTGVAAFGGLSVTFLQTSAELGRERNLGNLLQAVPLGVDFVRAAYPTSKLALESFVYGFVLQPVSKLDELMGRNKAFTVQVGDQREDVANAKAVFAAIEKAGLKEQFGGALFRDDAAGWLRRVHECDASQTGQMLDRSVTTQERESFATTYLQYKEDASRGYSFLNGFTLPPANPREKRLPEQLLGRDHRRSSPDDTGALARVQAAAASKYSEWNNLELIRLVFANRDGAAAAQATMEVGHVSVRPVPSADSLFVYESLVDSCRRTEMQATAGDDDKPTPPAQATPASAPAKPPKASAKPTPKPAPAPKPAAKAAPPAAAASR